MFAMRLGSYPSRSVWTPPTEEQLRTTSPLLSGISWSGLACHNERAAASSAHVGRYKVKGRRLSFLFSCPTVASSSAEHDLHSNWLLRVPRVTDGPGQDPRPAKGGAQKHTSGSTSSRLRLQRNPIHLPKAVHSAFQSLRSRPKLKKWDAMSKISRAPQWTGND